ncbi:Domain of unknown function (DUF4205), putative [Angomonas deanei]|uniref:Deubiquitinating enzyme MINDY-3/4 conserved domain-containing protein n=1 Tax=Angomonas deanei TaxID=59799 RepID=A0A7G2CDC6_9TRYP|nr:Domain of unknown function (DUF4205), putative [Angomonas deanei]
MAAIQAYLCGYFFEKEAYMDTEEKQRTYLKKALLAILNKAQPQVRHILLVHGLVGKGSDANRRVQHLMSDQSHFYQWSGFSSTDEVERCMDALLDAEGGWCQDRGSGLWCFLVSVVLSRGSAAVGKDMDVTSSALIHEDGSGSLELCNLLLTGRAVSFTFNHDSSSHQRGYTSSTLVGILSGETNEEDDGDHVRTFATDPYYPSWVIHCNQKRYFSNVFMKKDLRKTFQQKKKLGGDITLEFVYWDCATEDDAIEVSVVVSSTGLLGKRRGVGSSSFVAKALLSIPQWADGTIDWCGNTPVRAP